MAKKIDDIASAIKHNFKGTKEQKALKEKFVEVFVKNVNNVFISCKKINISRRTYYNWYNDDEGFRDAIEEARESMIDFSESTLYKLINGYETVKITRRQVLDKDGNVHDLEDRVIERKGPDTTAVIFHLKTKGKARGYIEKQIISDENEYELRAEDKSRLEKLSLDEQKNLIKLSDKLFPGGQNE